MNSPLYLHTLVLRKHQTIMQALSPRLKGNANIAGKRAP